MSSYEDLQRWRRPFRLVLGRSLFPIVAELPAGHDEFLVPGLYNGLFFKIDLWYH